MGEERAEAPMLKRTPLYEIHRALGARLVEFGGWEMPVQYAGIIQEHRAVRERAGLFDVSHMGEFHVEGAGALAFLQSLVPNDISRLVDGQALYTQLLRPDGGTIDDLLVYRFTANHFMTVVNAGTMEKDWAWVSEHARGLEDVLLRNASDDTGLIALQGPLAQSILQPLTATSLDDIAYYHFRESHVAGIWCVISRTGYTGEDGFELYCASGDTEALWSALMEAGQPRGLQPAGLGARDTLRLEAGYCLYEHELTEEITPLEAGLGWTVKLKKPADFTGRSVLEEQRRTGLRRKLVGLNIRDRAIPRAGYAILHDGERVGKVTSGTMSPTLERPIALGYVPPDLATPGTSIAIDIRGRSVEAEVAALPFYKRSH